MHGGLREALLAGRGDIKHGARPYVGFVVPGKLDMVWLEKHTTTSESFCSVAIRNMAATTGARIEQNYNYRLQVWEFTFWQWPAMPGQISAAYSILTALSTTPRFARSWGIITHRLHSSSFWGVPYRILHMNPKKELLWSL